MRKLPPWGSPERAALTQRIHAGPIAIAEMVAHLSAAPCTYEELQAYTGLNDTTIRQYIAAFKRRGLLHIAEWEPDSRGFAGRKPAFLWGEGSDAPRSVRTATERNRDYRERQKQVKMLHAIVGGDYVDKV